MDFIKKYAFLYFENLLKLQATVEKIARISQSP